MLNDKIRGLLFGYAIGDALGLGTEFMTRREVSANYPDGLDSYSRILRDGHRSQWKRGQFTHDTTIVLLMVDSILACRKNDYIDFARRLKEWFTSHRPIDVSAELRWIICDPDFSEHPHLTCRKIYNSMNDPEPRNEALGRALIAGIWPRFSESEVIDNTRITHWDPLCVAPAVAIATIAHELIWHDTDADTDKLYGLSHRIDPRFDAYLDIAFDGTLDELQLDDEDTMWAAPKSAAAAIMALRKHTDPAEALYEIVSHGGDADTNGALAMALMGLKYGYSSLPKHLIDGLLDRQLIEDAAEALTSLLEEVR